MNDTSPARMHGERGSALLVILITVVICGALAFGALAPALSRHREAQALIQRERAFQVAEAGIDWGIAEMRASGGSIPDPPTITGTPGAAAGGAYSITYTAGNANGRDDNGDTVVDDEGEAALVEVVSSATVDDHRRTIRVMLRKAVDAPAIGGAIQFNVEEPILDLNGNAFYISGTDHALDGSEDLTKPEQAGIAAPADEDGMVDQIDSKYWDQVVGLGGEPSVDQIDPIDLDTLVEQAKSAATITLSSGTHTNVSLGTATADGVVIAVSDGNIKFSGTAEGAGILVVDGDLDASGEFVWIGIVIVRGRVNFTGGGSGKRIVGSLIVGEEVSATTSTSEIKVTGTVDMLFSSEAVALAQSKLATLAILSWQEVANP